MTRRNSLQFSSLSAIAATACLGVAGAAFAHAKLVAAAPAVGGQVKTSPSEIRITFSEGVIAKFSGATVTDKAGHAAPVGEASVAKDDRKQLVVPLKAPLAPGVYTVTWRAVSADTHRVQGHYSFTVG
jgi:copper resistance protein C